MNPHSIQLWMSIIMSSSKILIGTYSSHFTQYEGWKTSSSHSPFLVGFVEIVTFFMYSDRIYFQINGLWEISWERNQQELIKTLSFLSNLVPGLTNFSAKSPGAKFRFVTWLAFIPSCKFL